MTGAAEVGGVIGKPREQLGSGVEVVDGFSVGAALELVVGGHRVVADGTVEVAASGEVHGDGGGEGSQLRPVGALQKRADAQVVARGAGGADPPAEDIAIEVVVERERRRDRAVWPGPFSAGMDEHASPGEVGEDRFDVFVWLLGCC